jgi:hypothetical protein
MDTSGDQGGALYGSSDSGAPAAPSLSPFQQLLQQRANDPNKALWDSLGSAGAAILGGKDLKDGLAAGGDAFNKQYDKTFKEQQEQNTPKVTPMADGAFSMVQLPGQPPQVVPNEKVAEFLRQKQILATEAGTQKALTVMNARAQAQQNQQNRKYGQESAPLALQFQQQDTDIDNARKLEAGGPNAPQLAAALFPKLAGATDAPQVALQQLRARIAATNISLQTSMQKGATTDKERATIAQDVPDVTAGPEVWREFYDRTQPLVKKNYQYHQDRVNAAYEAGATGLQGQYKPAQQQPAQGTPAQPAASGGGVQSVTSKAAYDALPSGTTYKGPDGKLRTRQ